MAKLIIGRRSLVTVVAATAVGCATRGAARRAEPGSLRIAPLPGAPLPGSSRARTAGARPPFSVVLEQAPPLDVSPEIDPLDQAELTQLVDLIGPLYEQLGRAWDTAPLGCALSEAPCVPAWERSLRLLAEIDEENQRPPCDRSGSPRTARTAREEAHRRFIARQTDALRRDLRAAARASGAGAAYEALTVTALPLSPGRDCNSQPYRFDDAVPFAAQDASLSPFAAETLEKMSRAIERSAPIRALEVRGHVDRAEKGDARALSHERATAVAEWLAQNAGIPASSLVVIALRAALPVDTSATPEGRAQNRRVDFQPR